MDAIILLLLFVSSFVTQTVYSQDVDIRATGDKVNPEGSAQARTIYSSRQLSPHRMMHFGKRPALFESPTILAAPTRGFDLYPQRQQQFQLLPESRYPYLLSIELERGQTLQPEDFQARRNLMYTFERPQAPDYVINAAEQQQQQAANALAGQRFLRLMSGDSSASAGAAATDSADDERSEQNNAENRAQSQEGSQQKQQQQQQQQPQAAISINTRSGRPSLNLPKAYISTLLYGRQGASPMPSFGSYNKKAEPKENFYMHFGRK